MSREEMAELWIARINDYRASGESVAAWCERHQVTSYQLFYWMRKLKAADRKTPAASKPKWVTLSIQEPTTDEAPPIVVKIGSAAVEVRAGFDASLFADVIRTLKALC